MRLADESFQAEVSEPAGNAAAMEIHKGAGTAEFDDDGKPRRRGNMWTASAHIITAIIGSGVLSLAWGVAQLGWIAGVLTLMTFPCITLYTSSLLADCYRQPDTGKRNYTYREIVRNNLGGVRYVACVIVQYANLCGTIVGYTITASISLSTIQKSECLHRKGHGASCTASHNPYMVAMGILEIILSQIPNFHKLSILSVVAAAMSFGYSSIGVGLAFSKIVSGNRGKTSITGVQVGAGISSVDKVWRVFRALGDMAFAYSYSQILVEIQDTIKASPPEQIVMKRANIMAVSTTTGFYLMCGCFGYAAFGNDAPGNLLTGFAFYEPSWVVDLANACIVLHLIGAYQVFAQPVFSGVESRAREKWGTSNFVAKEYTIGVGSSSRFKFNIDLLRLVWRTSFVIVATFFAMLLPFFNDILALLGAIGYWPLTVYFPIELHISRNKIKRWTLKWLGLQLINLTCFIVAVGAASGSIQGLSNALKTYKPFKFKE